jgi:hypothetical protein
LNVQQVTSSIVFSSGSNIFGNDLGNTQQLTGSVSVTGSMTVNGTGTFSSTLTSGSPLSIKATAPFIRWLNDSDTRLGYIQHNATNLVYNADTGVHIFNQILTAASTGGSGLRIYGAAGTNQWDMYLNGANLRFSDNTSGGRFVVDSPSTLNTTLFSSTSVYQVSIKSTGAQYLLVGSENASGVGIILDGDSNGDGTGGDYSYITHESSGVLNIVQDSPSGINEIRFGTAGTENKVVINSSGNVGIGATNPGTRLEVSSTAPIGDRTLPHNILTLTAEQGNAPYGGFGGAILFKNRSYVSGLVESSRIRSVIYDDGAPNNFGGGLWFETTPTPGGTLTPSVVINYQGRVGIGTTSPEALLHLSQASTGGNGAFIFVDNPASSTLGNTAGIRFATNAGASFSGYGSFIQAVNTNAGDGAEALTFGTWNGASRGERMRINANGDVGIGLTNPGAILDVSHTAGTTNIIRVSNGAGNYRWRIDQLFSMVMTNASNVDTFSVNTSGAGYFANNVGIGTGSPTEGLVVARGAFRVTSQAFDFSSGTRGISIDTTDGNLGRIYTVTGTGTATDLAFGTNNTERMRITTGGNVGIGETNPGSKLHVSGDTFTNGRFALPFGSVRTYSALGNITINVGNLPVLDGNNWRQASIMVFYSGVSGGLEQGYHNVTFIRLRGLTSWNDLNVTDIVGSASISLSSNTTTGCILTLNVNSIITGSAMAMLASGTSGQLS